MSHVKPAELAEARGRNSDAADHYARALTIARDLDGRLAAARAKAGMGQTGAQLRRTLFPPAFDTRTAGFLTGNLPLTLPWYTSAPGWESTRRNKSAWLLLHRPRM